MNTRKKSLCRKRAIPLDCQFSNEKKSASTVLLCLSLTISTEIGQEPEENGMGGADTVRHLRRRRCHSDQHCDCGLWGGEKQRWRFGGFTERSITDTFYSSEHNVGKVFGSQDWLLSFRTIECVCASQHLLLLTSLRHEEGGAGLGSAGTSPTLYLGRTDSPKPRTGGRWRKCAGDDSTRWKVPARFLGP